jgi:hypothetical protein
MKLIASLFLLACGPSVGWACSCVETSCWSIPGEYLAFVGTATKARAIDAQVVAVDFTVSEAWGELSGKSTLTVYTNAQSPACGYPFRTGVAYFVSANSRDAQLWTSKCSLTRPAIVASALIRQARAVHAGQPPAQLFGYVGVEPYPGVSPLSRLEAKPTASVTVTAVGPAGDFQATTKTAADGSFAFASLGPSTYRLRLQLPKDLFIWWAANSLNREYVVSASKVCEADFPLYPKDDPFAANQPR